MKLRDILNQTHDDYDDDRWCELDALAKGGKKFHDHIGTFLPRNPMEPELLYSARKERAKYHSYMGAIINLYVSWLFAASFSVKADSRDSTEPVEVDKFYGEFQENVSKEQSLSAFIKDRFREAMTQGKANWLVELPPADPESPPADRAEYDARGLGRARLLPIDNCELLNWDIDDEGNYLWCVLKTKYLEQLGPLSPRDVIVEQWRIYDQETVTVYELRYTKSEPAGDREPSKLGEAKPHGFKRVPIVTLTLPEELCVGEQTYDAQVEHFRHDAALAWAIYRTCYAMPVFHLEDGEKPPTMGVGYGLMLGHNDKVDWLSPPPDSFQTIAANRDAKRDEIFRIVHQMAQGLDNNAETVGRSAESKEIDAAATRIMLNAYGEMVGQAIEETYEIISEARNELDYEWSVEGFSGYDTATAGSLLGNVKAAKDLGIPSETFLKEATTKAALALLPEVDQKTKDAIRQEIKDYKFEVTGQTAEAALQNQALESQEGMQVESLKSQEKTAAASLKAKQAGPPAGNPSKPSQASKTKGK